MAVRFADLTARQVHDLLRLRQDVFVVEQACAYADIDGRDTEDATRHVLLQDDSGASLRLLGCARVLDDTRDGLPVWRVGRVLLHPDARGRGLAEVVLQTALAVCRGRDVVLDAQAAVTGVYAALGFVADGPEFVEDGIAHVPMRLRSG